MRKIKLEREPNYKPLHNAFPYQQEAYEAIKDLPYAAVFHEQGLGKTKIAIDLLLYWLSSKDIDTVLIVTKKQLVLNWQEEFRTHTHINPKTLTNNKGSNFYVFNGPSRVVITNFEVVTIEKERFKLYLKSRNVAIIIDESAKLKNPSSKLANDFFELSELFKIKVIMTGTPVANRPFDIWAQVFFLDGGSSLGKDFKRFKESMDLSNDLVTDRLKRKEFEKAISGIFNRIKLFSVRETKDSGVVVLPNREYIDLWTSFTPDQLKMYNKVKKDLLLEIQNGDETILDDSTGSLKRLLRLVQITSSPKLVDNTSRIKSAKERELDELVESIVNKGEKCIVWTSFIDNVDYFTEKYKPYNAVKIHGRLSIEKRNAALKRFKAGDSKMLIATPQSAKEGLTLTVANHVIFYDRGFSLDDYLQAQDRIHRISQEKTCYVYNIMTKGSIDEWIDLLLKAKKNAASLVQGDVSIDDYKERIDYSYGTMVRLILGIDE